MKRRQQTPATLIGLRGIRELGQIRKGDGLTIGAGVSLSALTSDDRVRHSYPGLWQAAVQVATPHLRNMGTIGGNLCLDTRCTYYDQTYEWRKAINFCMKRDGDTCWVATSSPKCLAVSSTDTAPMLQALGATVNLASVTWESSRRSRKFTPAIYGMQYLTRHADEVLTTIALPPAIGWRSAYGNYAVAGRSTFQSSSVSPSGSSSRTPPTLSSPTWPWSTAANAWSTNGRGRACRS